MIPRAVFKFPHQCWRFQLLLDFVVVVFVVADGVGRADAGEGHHLEASIGRDSAAEGEGAGEEAEGGARAAEAGC